jgi:hypothetical protein
MDAAMTVEPEPHGYGQHLVTVERGNAESVQTLILTDMELMQLECLLENYRATGMTVAVRFVDPSGRPPVIQEVPADSTAGTVRAGGAQPVPAETPPVARCGGAPGTNALSP